ncbi:hypothetical protein EUX98_g7725 [Antrodiella citrinella]|uniref:RlpA-like protein double-psi beta-barrel domain-containing protein n=1 Tax=Antrodiella citrinella TaxID=2447956 RepID=A0A4S4MMP5_9APHY|nr:hypothetical protein EUX98_g7725 [Antrodiella citrinella]
MFTLIALATLALSAVSVNGLAIPREIKPATYSEGYLENYQVYHERYMALDCEDQHNTSFFTSCCHPLLATESLEKDRPAECNPANLPVCESDSPAPTSSDAPAPSSSVAPVHSSSVVPPPSSSAAPSTHAAPASSTHAPAPSPAAAENVGAEPPKVTSSAAPSSSPAPPKSTPPPPPPAPTTTKAAPPATTKAAAPASGNSVNTGGFGTFFYQNGVAGACGKVNPDTAAIVAIDQDRYGNSGNASPLCGQQVLITNTNNGKTVVAVVADDCPTCTNANSIDMSVGAFTQIATEEEGEVPISWVFL